MAASALGVALLAGLGSPARVTAGTYLAVACEPSIGALTPETASFEQSSPLWRGTSCASAATPWLTVGIGERIGPPDSFAQWRISAPSGLRFRGGHFQADPASLGAYQSSYLYRIEGTLQEAQTETISAAGRYAWPRAGQVLADQLVLRTACINPGGCFADSGRPTDTLTLVGNLQFQIEDYSPATIGDLEGALMEGAAQRGSQVLAVPAADQGSGIARVTLRVNGERAATLDPGCALAPDGRALRLAPCPSAPTSTFGVDTTSSRFSEGENSIEVCVSDYAQETNDPASLAAEACATGGVYVDNSCPVSEGPDAAELRFGFGRKASRGQTVGYGKRPRVRATLDNAAGKPIEGATVCVTERDRVGRARERDVRTLKTNRRGNAKMRLPKGASRDLKLTYWSNDEDVETETARLNVRARPRLRVLSKRKLSDGGEVRFRVTLPGEYRRGRTVAVQALAPAGWLDFPGCVGRTNKKGDFACSYHFREQSGSVKYKFRALAPRQPGYPYLQGRSRSEKLIVRD